MVCYDFYNVKYRQTSILKFHTKSNEYFCTQTNEVLKSKFLIIKTPRIKNKFGRSDFIQ